MFVKFDISTWSPSSLKLSQLKHELADHEVTRIERFLFQADQNRALIGQILVRRLIASLLPPSEIDNIIISRTEHGKPYLERPSPPEIDAAIHFNLSHHGSWVIAGASRGRPIGVDVSLVSIPCSDTVESFLACFQHYFTPLEWKGIKSCNWDTSHSELHAFFRLWCLKEAYTKALGLGLGLDLLKIEFRMDQAAFWRNRDGNVQTVHRDIQVWEDGVHQSQWQIALGYIDETHPFAVVLEGDGLNLDKGGESFHTLEL